MDANQIDVERLMIFEHSRITAEAAYAKNPYDADNLTKWGGALLELSQFSEIRDSMKMIKEAMSKLDEALAINPSKHEALWCLGNAHTTIGFITPDHDEAQFQFEQAAECFQKAVDECPGNEHYLQSLANTSKAPRLHNELHRHGGPASSSSSSAKDGPAKKKSSDLKYDICGWIILAAGIVAWVGMGRSHGPPQ